MAHDDLSVAEDVVAILHEAGMSLPRGRRHRRVVDLILYWRGGYIATRPALMLALTKLLAADPSLREETPAEFPSSATPVTIEEPSTDAEPEEFKDVAHQPARKTGRRRKQSDDWID